jgi:muconate/chloromuconate cycloisomerase
LKDGKKITGLDTVRIKMPYHRPHTLSFGTTQFTDIVFVRLTTDVGIEGVGEASLLSGPYWSEESAESVQAVCENYLRSILIGMDPLEPSLIADKMALFNQGNPFARAAIEMAVFDIAGKALKVPAYQLLGGRRRNEIPIIWTLAAGNPDEEILEADRMNEQYGITTFKVKIGHLSPKEDLARVDALVKGLGDRYKIRLDANQGWNEVTASGMLREFSRMSIELIEQPVPKGDIAALARLRAMGLVPIMADEAASTAEEVLNIIKHDAADALALKVTKAGGMLATCHIGFMASTAGIPCVMGGMIESGIGTAAYLQVAASISDLSYGCVLFGPLMHKASVIKRR